MAVSGDGPHYIDNSTGYCVTGKVRYADDIQASIALERVRLVRARKVEDKPPERTFYECPHCDGGWHLTSKPPALDPPPAEKADGETWEEYAHRLERRIKMQRDTLEQINLLRADAGNRAERKRIDRLTVALGRMTERWEKEKEDKRGLIAKLDELQPDRHRRGSRMHLRRLARRESVTQRQSDAEA